MKEVKNMNAKGVRLKVVGNTSQLAQNIQDLIRDAELAPPTTPPSR